MDGKVIEGSSMADESLITGNFSYTYAKKQNLLEHFLIRKESRLSPKAVCLNNLLP